MGMDAAGILGGVFSGFGSLVSTAMTNNTNRRIAAENNVFNYNQWLRQLEAERENWRMNNEYNLPSAQMQRLKDAGLNPLLMYGQGGVSNVAQSAPGSGQRAQGSMIPAHFENFIDRALSGYANMKMLQAQTKLMESEANKTDAEAEQTKSMTDWQEIENKFSRESYQIRLAIQHGNLEQINVNMEKMRNEIANSSMLTSQQLQTMMQARMYEIKRFDLDKETYGANVQQGWKHLANEAVSVRAQYKNAAAAWLNAQTQANLSKWQIGVIAQDILYRSQEQPLKMKRLSLDNALARWDTHLKRAALNEKQRNIVNQELKNYYLKTYGSESVPQGHLYKEVAPWVNNLTNTLEFMFVYPNQGK